MGTFSRWTQLRAAETLAAQIQEHKLLQIVASLSQSTIPVLVISFNNGRYVSNMVRQLNSKKIFPLIIDNASTDVTTRLCLKSLELDHSAVVVYCKKNLGHLVGFLNPVYQLLPEIFAYTDPDLQFHETLPEDFLEQLATVAENYKIYKAGMALDLKCGTLKQLRSNTIRKYPFEFEKIHSIEDWEQQFWMRPLKHPDLEIYAASVDTTFAVYRKAHFNGEFAQGVRVAGVFSAVHLPWFSDLDITSIDEQDQYRKSNRFSAWNRKKQI